jgi:hypothetical protein
MQKHSSEIASLMADTWNETLRCPVCGKTGLARVSQHPTDETLAFECVPEGFMVVMGRYSPNFYCRRCDVPAEP